MKNNLSKYKLEAGFNIFNKCFLFPNKEIANYCITGANMLNEKILHYNSIGDKVVHLVYDSTNRDFSDTISESYHEFTIKSLMESIIWHYGGEVIDSDSLVALILGRFNGSESHCIHKFYCQEIRKI